MGYRYFNLKNEDTSRLDYNTNLIRQQILNVGKLVVTEGYFAEVITYKDQDKYLMNMVSFEKKAIVIVTADVTVAYDLYLLQYDIDEKKQDHHDCKHPKRRNKNQSRFAVL